MAYYNLLTAVVWNLLFNAEGAKNGNRHSKGNKEK